MKHPVNRPRWLLIILTMVLAGTWVAGAEISGENCFSILVGRTASADGAVYFAHNEDDPLPQIVNWIKIPHLKHNTSERIHLKEGASLPQVPETNACIWLQMPGTSFSDSYMNEFGVTISSNRCPSRVQQAALTDGGIGYWLRRLMAERARTAKEAVQIGAALVEKFGYSDTGRTYCIADPHEAWVLSVVRGRIWIAVRVPDDSVVVIANRYTIGEVDVSDTANVMSSVDLIPFAEKMGWYDPARDGAFNFRQTYGDPAARYNIRNLARQWRGVTLLSGKDWSLRKPLPFSFQPERKIDLVNLMTVLRDHYEGSQFETPVTYNRGNPHENYIMRICSNSNQYGFVAQLRPNLPVDVGAVMWLAPRRPCVQPFVPVYCGIQAFPRGFSRKMFDTAIADQFKHDADRYTATPDLAYWSFYEHALRVDADYGDLIPDVRVKRGYIQKTLLDAQPSFEKSVVRVFNEDKQKGRTALTRFTAIAVKQLLKFNSTN